MIRLLKSSYVKHLRAARLASARGTGREICGLIVDSGYFLSFVSVRNISRRAGSFILSARDVRRVVSAAKLMQLEIVGTFHSHPVSEARPGQSDIAHAVDDSLMFIFDCTGNTGALWKIKNGKARKVRYSLLH